MLCKLNDGIPSDTLPKSQRNHVVRTPPEFLASTSSLPGTWYLSKLREQKGPHKAALFRRNGEDLRIGAELQGIDQMADALPLRKSVLNRRAIVDAAI